MQLAECMKDGQLVESGACYNTDLQRNVREVVCYELSGHTGHVLGHQGDVAAGQGQLNGTVGQGQGLVNDDMFQGDP